jgi:phage gpG-like protein
MDDLEKQFAIFYNNVKSTLNTFPVIAGNVAVNFFQDSFNKQGWIDTKLTKWKQRKDKGKKSKGRAILVRSGRLKRAIRLKHASWGAGVLVVNDTPYAAAHNEGVNETQQVKSHQRTSSRIGFIKGGYSKLGDEKRKGRKIKMSGAEHQVKSFSRKMVIPKRQFIGNSSGLNLRIEREFIKRLNKL